MLYSYLQGMFPVSEIPVLCSSVPVQVVFLGPRTLGTEDFSFLFNWLLFLPSPFTLLADEKTRACQHPVWMRSDFLATPFFYKQLKSAEQPHPTEQNDVCSIPADLESGIFFFSFFPSILGRIHCILCPLLSKSENHVII